MPETTIAPGVAGIGARQVRLEDEALLTGRAMYSGDVRVDGLTHAVFVRSPVAHAHITGLDASEAVAMPGVVAVLTHDDLPTIGPVFFPSFAALFSSDAYHRRPLAGETVRFVGDIVAIVIAESLAVALDAAQTVIVDFDLLPVVVDPVAAASEGAPLLFPETGSNVAVTSPLEVGTCPDDATVAVNTVITNHRMSVAPMEGIAITAIPDDDGEAMTAYVSAQLPHGLRDISAGALGMDASKLRLITPAVGGGFGGKTPVEPDYVAILAAARHIGRPVQWVQSRSENLLTMQARGHRFDVTMRATPAGKIGSVEVDALTDVGAYPGVACGMIMTTRTLVTGPYDIPHARFDIRCVATNTAPPGPFRGAGRPEAADLLERSIDVLAAELGMDPVEVRRRNLIRPEQFPFRTLTGLEYDTGDYERCLDEALRIADYARLRSEQSERRAEQGSRHLGIGVSFYVEVSAATPGFTNEYASVEVGVDGRAKVIVGTCAHGQGHHTTYAQIVASTLGISVDRVDFLDGDTALVKSGAGTGGSRSAQVGGSAVKVAADGVLAKAKLVASHLLEAAVDDLVVTEAGLAVNGVPTSKIPWSELATAASDPSRLPPDLEPGLFADPGFAQSPMGTSPFGCHVAVVEVDEETGKVDLIRMIAVDDCGVVINPLLAEGQVHGGLLGGIGQALFEEARFDDDGNPLTTTFADYGMPTAAELPSFETGHTVTPTFHNPLGAKGLGEAGTTGSLPAVHNAVVDALSHLGIRHIEMPLTPFNVWAALQSLR